MRALVVHVSAGLALACASTPVTALTIAGTYYEDTVFFDCPSAVSCTGFMPLPSATAGQFLTLNEISCNGIISKPIARGAIFLSDNGQNPRRYHSLTTDPDPTTPSGFVTFREPVIFKIAGGPPRRIEVNFATDGNATFNLGCMVVGTLSAQ